MGVINDISIYQVETREEKGKSTYSVEVCWSAKVSPGSYTEKWRVVVKENSTGSEIASEEVSANVRMHQFLNLTMDKEKRYVVCVSGAKQETPCAEEWVMLKTYRNVTGNYDRKKIRLTWDTPDSDIGEGKCGIRLKKDGKDTGGIFDYEIPPYVRGMEIPFPDEFFCQKEAFKVVLTPYYNQISSGPQAVIENLFAPDYRMDKEGELSCHCTDTEKMSLSLELHASPVYKEAGGNEKVPENSITHGALLLTNTEPYTLTVQTDTGLNRADYDSFIKDCYQYVTPEAMYEILDFISRSATQKTEDMLYYSCGLSETAQRADIRPGYTIRIEQAAYQYQQQMDEKDISGYIGSGVFTYKVSLHQGREMSYLEFDSFVSRMNEELYSIDSKAAWQQIGAGVLELCSVNMRQPYYRIQYPEGMYTSDVLPDSYPNTHVILLAAPCWDEAPLPVNGQDNASVPYLFFRGRSAVTLLFTISVNGKEEEIPAGTTLGKLLNQKGIYHVTPDVVRLFRRNPYGREAEIVIDGESGDRSNIDRAKSNMLSQLPLMNGDRIEI